MSRAELLRDLAERCHRAPSNSWDLDCEIFKACAMPKTWMGSKVISWFGVGPFGCNTADGRQHRNCLNSPNYTDSIDVASSLIGKRNRWTLDFRGTSRSRLRGYCAIYLPGNDIPALPNAEGEGTTPALAMCEAALRLLAYLDVRRAQ